MDLLAAHTPPALHTLRCALRWRTAAPRLLLPAPASAACTWCTCARKHCTRLCKSPAHTFRSQHCNHHHYHTACLGREIGRTWASLVGGPRDCSPRCIVFASCFCRRAAVAVSLYLSLFVCVCVYECMDVSVRACLFVVVSARVSCVTELFSLLPNLCLLPPKPRTQPTPDCTPMVYSTLSPCLQHSPLHPPHTGGAVRAGSRLQQDGALLLHEGAGRLLPRQRAGLVRRLAPRAPPVGLLLPPQVECLIRTGACRALLRSCFCFRASGGRHGLRTWDDSDRCQGGLAGTVGL